MSNNPLMKKSSLDGLLRGLMNNKVILMFAVLCIGCILVADTSISYIASEVFARFARNTCLVLALIIPCMAGLGMNFGIVVGAIAAQISIFWIVHWGFTGITGFLLCVLFSTPLAILFGWLVGILYNKTKGTEMITGLVLGFFAAGLYRLFTLYIMGGVIPFDDPMLLDRGFGLRNTIELQGNIKYALDDITFLTTLIILGTVMILAAAVVALHGAVKKQGVDLKKTISKIVSGVVLVAIGVVGPMIPFVKELLGGTRLSLLTTVQIGAPIAVIYVAAMFLIKRPKVSDKLFKSLVALAVVAVALFAISFLEDVKFIFNYVRLPAMTYAIICLFCFFNSWITNTRLGQNMRTVGQNRAVATSAGINVDRTRIIATCISTVLAAWGQLIFLQNLGTFNTVQQQDNVGLYAIAAILVGGASVQKASNKHAIIGVFLFHTLFVVAPLAATKIVGDPAVSEYIRMFISYGVIAVSLALHAHKSVAKKKDKKTEAAAAPVESKDPA